jgi:uncharacterized protein (TIGR03067 family)
MPRVALLFGSALCLAFAPAPLPRRESATATLAALQGQWQPVSDIQDGHRHESSGVEVAIVGSRMRYVIRGRVTAEYSVVLYPAANPPRFDRRDVEVPDRTLLGTYRLEGDTLTANWASWGIPRPTALDDLRPGHTVSVYRRVRR